MAEHSRYHVSDNKAGIENSVLVNKLNIKDQQSLSDAETVLLADAYEHFFNLLEGNRYSDEKSGQKKAIFFDLAFLFLVHKFFFKPLYSWAGKIRTVDISKDGVLFIPVKYLDKALNDFDTLILKTLPKENDKKSEIAHKLAVIHNEFNIIHPFREGNGRTIRLFLDLIVISLGYNPIDWNIKGVNGYIEACINGVAQKHDSMRILIKKGLSNK